MKMIHTVNIIYELSSDDVDNAINPNLMQLFHDLQEGTAVFYDYVEAGVDSHPTFIYKRNSEGETT